jgi:hypothetical protein
VKGWRGLSPRSSAVETGETRNQKNPIRRGSKTLNLSVLSFSFSVNQRFQFAVMFFCQNQQQSSTTFVIFFLTGQIPLIFKGFLDRAAAAGIVVGHARTP